MVTCELSHVLCCLRGRQHNMRDMQFTRIREKLVKSLKTALGGFRKRSGRGMCALTFCGGESPRACVKYTQAWWHLPPTSALVGFGDHQQSRGL